MWFLLEARDKFLSLRKDIKSDIVSMLQEELHNARSSLSKHGSTWWLHFQMLKAKKRFEFVVAQWMPTSVTLNSLATSARRGHPHKKSQKMKIEGIGKEWSPRPPPNMGMATSVRALSKQFPFLYLAE
ncbi:unnamed protein product [Cuscuta europaea]|uniref:Uncharacterized protein n=1 Tax=Cuscuta europaea TaxID=41803 RepID=A0A9P1EJD6_CUSEU|nr:unnamed protein product [Cuscuta europaea]